MFERFTDRARRVVVLAQEEARMLDHHYIGTEHILLGLIREDEGVGARALGAMGIALTATRESVLATVGQGSGVTPNNVPFTPHAKNVLELSLREALQLGHDYIGTEHILLGLIREGEGVAAQVLQKLGADLDRVRQTVLQLLSGYAGGEETEPAASSAMEEGIVTTFGGHLAGRGGQTADLERDPICPNCEAPLSENARLKAVDTQVGDEPVQMRIAYCGACGVALGIKVL